MMIIKGGKKYIIKIACLVGVPFVVIPLIIGLFFYSPFIALGVLDFFIILVLLLFFKLWFKFIEKKVVKLREEILKERKIICEGLASNKTDRVIGGWLFLSEAAVEFYPYNINGEAKGVAILLDDIVNIEVKKDLLIVKSSSKEFVFKVYNAPLWEEMIKKEL